jgi:hypothetical protein
MKRTTALELLEMYNNIMRTQDSISHLIQAILMDLNNVLEAEGLEVSSGSETQQLTAGENTTDCH